MIRRHGLTRCRYKGDAGMQRWVGLGVLGDTLINLGTALARAKQADSNGNAADCNAALRRARELYGIF